MPGGHAHTGSLQLDEEHVDGSGKITEPACRSRYRPALLGLSHGMEGSEGQGLLALAPVYLPDLDQAVTQSPEHRSFFGA